MIEKLPMNSESKTVEERAKGVSGVDFMDALMNCKPDVDLSLDSDQQRELDRRTKAAEGAHKFYLAHQKEFWAFGPGLAIWEFAEAYAKHVASSLLQEKGFPPGRAGSGYAIMCMHEIVASVPLKSETTIIHCKECDTDYRGDLVSACPECHPEVLETYAKAALKSETVEERASEMAIDLLDAIQSEEAYEIVEFAVKYRLTETPEDFPSLIAEALKSYAEYAASSLKGSNN